MMKKKLWDGVGGWGWGWGWGGGRSTECRFCAVPTASTCHCTQKATSSQKRATGAFKGVTVSAGREAKVLGSATKTTHYTVPLQYTKLA